MLLTSAATSALRTARLLTLAAARAAAALVTATAAAAAEAATAARDDASAAAGCALIPELLPTGQYIHIAKCHMSHSVQQAAVQAAASVFKEAAAACDDTSVTARCTLFTSQLI